MLSLYLDGAVSHMGHGGLHVRPQHYLTEEFLQVAHSHVLHDLSKDYLKDALASDFLQAVLEDMVVTAQEHDTSRVRMLHMSAIPDTLYMTAERPRHQLHLRVVREVGLPDTATEVLQNAHFYYPSPTRNAHDPNPPETRRFLRSFRYYHCHQKPQNATLASAEACQCEANMYDNLDEYCKFDVAHKNAEGQIWFYLCDPKFYWDLWGDPMNRKLLYTNVVPTHCHWGLPLEELTAVYRERHT
nr:hypothetical protein BaRGS_015022 [Batillaria attramentaria]